MEGWLATTSHELRNLLMAMGSYKDIMNSSVNSGYHLCQRM